MAILDKIFNRDSKKIITPEVIELGKDVPTSIIAVQRETELSTPFLDPQDIDDTYAVVPEISRAIDLRGAAIIYRGFEVSQRGDSQEALNYAGLCLQIINNSGGVSFIEQWQKNADAYGNGYVELVDDGSRIVKLAHLHSKNFGYELEEYDDEGTPRTRVKLDKDTQTPTAFAKYKLNTTTQLLENTETYELERISHLKYKVIGDALYGISIIQPMNSSIINKLTIENAIVAAARMVATPKLAITGEFSDEEEARAAAKEAASLDVSDVIILNNGKDMKVINPGDIKLPELREIFVTNITTASGIPRPLLTSEGNDINKATMQELMRHMRENLRSNMHKIAAIFETEIFPRIGEKNGIVGWETMVPRFIFPEDKDNEDDAIVREERKAATLTSLSNSLMLLTNMTTGDNAVQGYDTEFGDAIKATLGLYTQTADEFDVNNDQEQRKIEEPQIDAEGNVIENSLELDNVGIFGNFSIQDNIDTIHQPDELKRQHYLVHQAFDAFIKGNIVRDNVSGDEISLIQLIKKHIYYVDLLDEHGLEHVPIEEGAELDELLDMRI